MTTDVPQRSRLTVESCSDRAAWDEFVERVDGPPFALWGWGEAVEEYGHDRWHLVARDGGEIVGALPVYRLRSRLFDTKLVSPPFGERASVLLAEEADESARAHLLERVRELADSLGVDFVSLRGADLRDPASFEHRQRFVTFSVDLTEGPDAVWDGIRDSRRRQIRQARDDPALAFSVGDSAADLREYFRLYLRSVRGHGTPPHRFSFYRRLWEELASSDNLRIGLIRKDGAVINGIIDLVQGSTVHQWGVVTDHEYRDRNGGSYLLWKSLEWAAEAGHDAYEFGRTREGTGVYTFKKSFGGEKRWYDDYHYFPGEAVDLPDPDDDSFEPLKRAWRRLPVPVTRVLGPPIRGRISL
ncbi:MAG: GNAT family N-acetyltransferase [Haloarculaceae archaeon]